MNLNLIPIETILPAVEYVQDPKTKNNTPTEPKSKSLWFAEASVEKLWQHMFEILNTVHPHNLSTKELNTLSSISKRLVGSYTRLKETHIKVQAAELKQPSIIDSLNAGISKQTFGRIETELNLL